MSITWWEKTVEYKFVLLVASAEKLFLAPLDGRHERAGDAIFSSNNRWVLIEFKKDSAAINSEIKKFKWYPDAKAALSSCDLHHHIVFGYTDSSSPEELKLRFRTYFSAEQCGSLEELLNSGQQFAEFKNYVEQYIQFKKDSMSGKGSTGGSGTEMTIEDFALVAGVNADNKVFQCLSLSEFQRQFGLELQQEPRLPRGPRLSR